ncbi:hypothetical protein PMAYCL1PPCAC_07732, partial [Pristionchus mayeri]
MRWILLLLLSFVSSLSSLRILVISPTVARSHVVFMGSLADSLAEKGHTVHTIMIEVEKTDTNGTTKSDKVVFIPSTRPRSELHDLLKEDPFDESLEMLNIGVLLAIRQSLRIYAEDTVTQYDRFLKPLESPEGYDVGISENLGSLPLFLYRRLSVRRYVLASAIGLSSIMAEAMGVPMPPSYVPNPLSSRVSTTEMSIVDRARYLIDYIFAPPIYKFICKAQLDYLRQFDPDLLDVMDAKAGSKFVAVNFPLLLDHLRPYTRHVIHVGGITLPREQKEESIDKDLSSVIDRSGKGIVVISFGSLAETENLSDIHLKTFLDAFSKFPDYTFIWKFDVHKEKHVELFAGYGNVHAVRWLPQHSLLKHNKTLAFVTHCGANSVIEAASIGVPLVALPLFADQHYNGAAMLKKGTAVLLRKSNLSEAAIVEALTKVLLDERFRLNALHLSSALAKYPEDPRDRFVAMVEFVAEYGDTLDRPLRLSPLIFFNIDVILVFLLLPLILIFVLRKYCRHRMSFRMRISIFVHFLLGLDLVDALITCNRAAGNVTLPSNECTGDVCLIRKDNGAVPFYYVSSDCGEGAYFSHYPDGCYGKTSFLCVCR